MTQKVTLTKKVDRYIIYDELKEWRGWALLSKDDKERVAKWLDKSRIRAMERSTKTCIRVLREKIAHKGKRNHGGRSNNREKKKYCCDH